MSEIIRYKDADERKIAPGVSLRDKISASGINIAEVTINNGEYPVDFYALNSEVAMVIEGLYKQCTIQRKGQPDVTINAGDILNIPAGTPYRYVAEFCKVNLTSIPEWNKEQYTEVKLS